VRRMKWWAVAGVGAIFVLPGLARAQEPGEPAFTGRLVSPVVDVDNAPAGFKVPAGSCLAAPAPGCPEVTSVEYVEPTVLFSDPLGIAPEPNSPYGLAYIPNTIARYGPPPAALVSDVQQRQRKDYASCEVVVVKPRMNVNNGNYFAVTGSYQDCYETSYSEISVTLQRYRTSRWENLSNDFDRAWAPDQYTEGIASYDCDHDKSYPYRNETVPYHVTYGGKGYTTVVRSSSLYYTCPA
jgi:hypothetical protein